MLKMIALDLDGTVVNEKLEVSPGVLQTLKRVMSETEVKVVIATGRMFRSALPFARQIGITEPLITYQGAMLRGVEEPYPIHYHAPIPLDTAQDVLKMLLAQQYDVNVYLDDQMWTRPDNKFANLYQKTAGIQPNFSDDLLKLMNQPPTKLMVIDDQRVDQLLEQLAGEYSTRLSYCRSRSNFCEIIDITASKWNALKALADEYGILPEEIMAIGDQGNDLSMIRGAGVGVAMGDAPDYIKEQAQFVAPGVADDGVVAAIEEFVFKSGAKIVENSVS
jgi:Cof subfamily protein (haloacid dehalogenase superfamily)